MIYLTRINRMSLVLNSDLIETIQSTPDTVITLTNGRNYMVLESPEEIIGRIIDFRRCLGVERHGRINQSQLEVVGDAR